MNKTISLEQLPPQIENLLRTNWEGHESLVLEHNGKPVAVGCPDGWNIVNGILIKMKMPFITSFPRTCFEIYHKLLDKKFATGLTSEEEVKLAEVDQQLNDVEAAQPLITVDAETCRLAR